MVSNCLILASASPRRSELLRQAGVEFQVQPSQAPEPRWTGEGDPAEYVTQLAIAKAKCVSALNPERLVLGADTAVFLEHTLYGKPADLAEAKRMLASLSGKTHRVLTGVAFCRNEQVLKSWCAVSEVTFHELTDDIIQRYFQLVNPLDKAGAYGLQCHGEMLCTRFTGLRSTVVGLPIEEVMVSLRQLTMNATRTTHHAAGENVLP